VKYLSTTFKCTYSIYNDYNKFLYINNFYIYLPSNNKKIVEGIQELTKKLNLNVTLNFNLE